MCVLCIKWLWYSTTASYEYRSYDWYHHTNIPIYQHMVTLEYIFLTYTLSYIFFFKFKVYMQPFRLWQILFLPSHSASLFLHISLTLTSVAFKNLSSGATNFSFANKPASHLLPSWACHITPSFSSFLTTSFLYSFFHLRHFVYNQLYNFLALPTERSFYYLYSD